MNFSLHKSEFEMRSNHDASLDELHKDVDTAILDHRIRFVGRGSEGVVFFVRSKFESGGYIFKLGISGLREKIHEPLIGTFFGNRNALWKHAYDGPPIPSSRSCSHSTADVSPLLNVVGHHGGYSLNATRLLRFVVILLNGFDRIGNLSKPATKDGLVEILVSMASDAREAIDQEVNESKSVLIVLDSCAGTARSLFWRETSFERVLDAARGLIVQIVFTIRDLHLRWKFVHADLRMINIFYSKRHNAKAEDGTLIPSVLVYEAPDGSGDSYRLKQTGEEAFEFVIGDLGFSAIGDENVLATMGMKSWTEWSDLGGHFFHAGHDADLNTLALSVMSSVGTSILNLFEDGAVLTPEVSSGLSELFSFCSERLLIDEEQLKNTFFCTNQELSDGIEMSYLANYKVLMRRYKRNLLIAKTLEEKALAATSMYRTFGLPKYAALGDLFPARDLMFVPKGAVLGPSRSKTDPFWTHAFLSGLLIEQDQCELCGCRPAPGCFGSNKANLPVRSRRCRQRSFGEYALFAEDCLEILNASLFHFFYFAKKQ